MSCLEKQTDNKGMHRRTDQQQTHEQMNRPTTAYQRPTTDACTDEQTDYRYM